MDPRDLLNISAGRGDIEMVEFILTEGSKLEWRERDYKLTIDEAGRSGRMDIVELISGYPNTEPKY